MPTKEEWDETYIPSITKEPCTYCGEEHEQGKQYYHKYMRPIKAFAIELTDLDELLTDVIKMHKENERKTIHEIIIELGLDGKEVLKNELTCEKI